MSIDDDAPEELTLIGYEKLADHGFALPCFGQAEGANTVYVARSSRPGNSTAMIAGFDVYDSERPQPLPSDKRNRRVKIGEPWIDVFLWDNEVYVGTKPEIWASTANIRPHIAANAPLSLLNLAEGVPRVTKGDLARAAAAWLEHRLSASAASEWRVDTYLRGIAIRGLRRRLGEAAATGRVRHGLQNVELTTRDTTLTLHLPATLTELLRVTAADLADLTQAAHEFGLQLDIVRDANLDTTSTDAAAPAATVLVMRLRKGRGATQTQIPFSAVDSFFRADIRVRSIHNRQARDMTLSLSGGKRNTMKLQVPEMSDITDPVARFTRTSTGIDYEVYDVGSPEGQKIKELLDEGRRTGATHLTAGVPSRATWWRVL